jgi:ketosteroid isomerase-like protein
MSRQNVELVRRMQEAFLSSEPDRALAFFAPEVEWDVRERPGGQVWHGPSGVRRAMTEWSGAWEEWELVTERYLEAGEDKVLILWREHGRGKGSGVPVDQRGGILVTVGGGRILRGCLYLDQQAALKAAGLAE